jgi:hypothetical protein
MITESVEPKHVSGELTKERMVWVLEKAVQQIGHFGEICMRVVMGIYGDITKTNDQENCMYNLLVSYILSPKEYEDEEKDKSDDEDDLERRDEVDLDESQLSTSGLVQTLATYKGAFKVNSKSLYQDIVNLIALSFKDDILALIAKVKGFQISTKFKGHSGYTNLINQPVEDLVTKDQVSQFEEGVYVISRRVFSPIGKLIGYFQLNSLLHPDNDEMVGADEAQT